MPRDFEYDWEDIRAKGKGSFIFRLGVLFWGIPMSLIINLYLIFIAGFPFTPTLYYTIPIMLVMGVLWGYLMWFLLERKYQKINKR